MTTKKFEFDITDVVDEIAAVWAGADDEYVELVREYHKFAADVSRTDQAKSELKANIISRIHGLKFDYCERSLKAIEKIRARYTPAPETPQKTDTGRLCDITLWSRILPQKNTDELKTMWLDNQGDPDYIELVTAELRSRGDGPAKYLLATIEAGVPGPDMADLNKIEKGIALVRSSDMWHPRMDRCIRDQLRGFESRAVLKDLAAIPDKNPVGHRPAFSIPARA